MLALATDAAARSVAGCSTYWISRTAGQVGLLPGTYRIPLRARPLLRAALLDHNARGLPDYRLLADRDGGLLLTQRMANLIGRAAAHTSLPPPPAATSARRDRGPDGPFAADFTRHTSLTAAEPNQTVLTGRRTLVAAFTDAGRRRTPPLNRIATALTSRAAISDISCGATVKRQ
jgi:hypothetical protein